MEPLERLDTIKKFNDPDSGVDVLVTSLLSSSFGLNLQYCCNHLVILAAAENANVILQVIGRLRRLGQTKMQKVWVVTLARSYDNLLQHNQTVKILAQIAGEAKLKTSGIDFLGGIDPENKDKYAKAISKRGKAMTAECAEVIRKMLGQQCSRVSAAWGDMRDLEKPLRQLNDIRKQAKLAVRDTAAK
jgi:hypothetical protein